MFNFNKVPQLKVKKKTQLKIEPVLLDPGTHLWSAASSVTDFVSEVFAIVRLRWS